MPNLPPSTQRTGQPHREHPPGTAQRESDWEIPALVVAVDPGIPGRLLATHPAEDWCYRCRANAPCSMRLLAEAAGRLTRPRAHP
jgi:hypothetical protein